MNIPEYTSLEEKGFSLNIKEPAKIFEGYQCIITADEFDNWYKKNKRRRLYFRGVKEAKYKNYTSAQRLCLTNDYQNVGPEDIVKAHIDEMRLVHNGILPAYCDSMNIPCTDLFLLSCSQHHKNGISPLIDFTSSLDTSLFFMCYGANLPISGAGIDGEHDINNYVSLYTMKNPITLQVLCDLLVEGIIEDVVDKRLKDKKDIIQKKLKDTKNQEKIANAFNKNILTFFSYSKIRTLLYKAVDYYPILIENKPLKIKIEDFEKETKLIISNLNIVAQHGCFLYHEKGSTPLEEGLSCVDIHKSLIPYIRKKYLKPHKINEDTLFPTEDKIVSESTFNMMANIVAPQK